MAASADSALDLTAQVRELLGRNSVLESHQVGEYAIGSLVPLAVAVPTDVGAVCEVMRWAHARGVAVYPSGGRTLTHLGNNPSRPGIALDMTKLDRMVDFQPADLTVRAEAGMTVAHLDAELAQQGKYVPLAPPLPHRATIGGTLATGVSGPLRATYGLPRDWLIGVNVVGADGVMSKAGGQVVKNVTGYDLNRLYTGSLGTLAVITEATFKITPAPTAWAAVIATFEDDQQALSACQDLVAQAYAPHGLHLLNPRAARQLHGHDIPIGHGPVAIAIIAGRPASVKRRVEDTATAWLDTASTVHIVEEEKARRLTDSLADLPVDAVNRPTVCVRLNLPPSAIELMMTLDEQRICDVSPGIVADIGFGGGRLLWWDDLSLENPVHISDCLRNIQASASSLGGSAIVEICPPEAKELIDVWGPSPSAMEIMRRIKRQFDPEGILNPGRMIGGL